MCTGSFLTCWPCAWEPDLLLYISKLLKSLGNSYPLPVKPCVAHPPVSAVLPAPSPASWHTAEASSGEGGQPSPPASWVTQGPALVTSPAFSLVSFIQVLPVLLLLQLTPILSIFIWDHLLSASSSLLYWNHIFSFLSSSHYSNFLCGFSDSTFKLQVPNPLQPVL